MNELIEKKEQTIPGFGVAGMVMCPLGFQKSACLKQGCEMWVELNYNEITVARCAMAWLPTMMVELRQELAKLKEEK